MKYPQRVQDIINQLYQLNINLAKGTDDDRRNLSLKIGQQVCFELGSQWGVKSADPGRPQSKDAIAFNGTDQLHIWDWQNGSSREPNQFPDEVPLTESVGQNFISVAPGVNHLGAPVIIPSQPIPPDQPGSNPNDQVILLVKQLIGAVQALDSRLQNVERQNELIFAKTVTFPPPVTYEGSVPYLGKMTLTPKV